MGRRRRCALLGPRAATRRAGPHPVRPPAPPVETHRILLCRGLSLAARAQRLEDQPPAARRCMAARLTAAPPPQPAAEEESVRPGWSTYIHTAWLQHAPRAACSVPIYVHAGHEAREGPHMPPQQTAVSPCIRNTYVRGPDQAGRCQPLALLAGRCQPLVPTPNRRPASSRVLIGRYLRQTDRGDNGAGSQRRGKTAPARQAAPYIHTCKCNTACLGRAARVPTAWHRWPVCAEHF